MDLKKYGLNKAEVKGGAGLYILAGTHTLEIDEIKVIETRKKGHAFIVEFLVRESTNPEMLVGQRRNFFQKLDEDYGPANVKAFLIAAGGLDPLAASDAAAVAKEDWDEVFVQSVAKPIFTKKLVICEASEHQNKNPDKATGVYGKHTRYRWVPHPSVREALQGQAPAAKKSK